MFCTSSYSIFSPRRDPRAQSPEPRETTTKIEKNAITHHTKELTNTSSIYIVRVYILQV